MEGDEQIYEKKFIQLVLDEEEARKQVNKNTIQTDIDIKFKDDDIMSNVPQIMLRLPEIDEKLVKVSILTRLDIYNSLFREDIYDNICEKMKELQETNENFNIETSQFFKCFLYSAMVCEITKYNLHDTVSKTIDNIEVSDIQTKRVIKETIEDRKMENKKTIHKLLEYFKKHFMEDKQFLRTVIQLFEDNEINID